MSSEVASVIILGPKCQRTTLLKEEEEDQVHQNSHSSSTIVGICGVRVGNWVRQMIVATQATPYFNMSVSLPIKMECY